MTVTTAGWIGLVLFVLWYGLSQGSAGIVVAARAPTCFWWKNFGRIYGWVSVANGIGEGLGAWLGGAVFDHTGIYSTAFVVVILALSVGASGLWGTYGKRSGE